MRLLGIDSIRFICALIVVLTHIGNPVIPETFDTNIYFKVIHGIYNCLFNGPAAVIAFFIISGLVIHYPYVNGKQINIKEFYLKRYTRVVLPMFVVTIVAFAINRTETLGVFWSLYAELIYYTLYPIILAAKKHISIIVMVISSYLIGLLLIFTLTYNNSQSYLDLGNGLTWIIGLPCWLLGLILAEQVYSNTKTITFKYLVIIRILIFSISVILRIAKFHLEISNLLTLNLFALPVLFWLKYEIDYYKVHKVNKYLENAGKWSYSLYIVHLLSMSILVFFIDIDKAVFTDWLLMFGFSLLSSYVFYLIVEKPSHKLSQKIKFN